jgi:hypothetical protein
MAQKSKNNADPGAFKKSGNVILGKFTKENLSPLKDKNSINPLLVPEKIKSHPYVKQTGTLEILDMKSKKLIEHIDQTLSSLTTINPLKEGGFGYDHPAVKNPVKPGKKTSSQPSDGAFENLDEYASMLNDLKTVMQKLGENRAGVFLDSQKS